MYPRPLRVVPPPPRVYQAIWHIITLVPRRQNLKSCDIKRAIWDTYRDFFSGTLLDILLYCRIGVKDASARLVWGHSIRHYYKLQPCKLRGVWPRGQRTFPHKVCSLRVLWTPKSLSVPNPQGPQSKIGQKTRAPNFQLKKTRDENAFPRHYYQKTRKLEANTNRIIGPCILLAQYSNPNSTVYAPAA